MLRTFRRWIACLVAACALAGPVTPAPAQGPQTTTATPPGVAPPPTPERGYAAEIFVAFLAVAVVLIVVCMPSRKQF